MTEEIDAVNGARGASAVSGGFSGLVPGGKLLLTCLGIGTVAAAGLIAHYYLADAAPTPAAAPTQHNGLPPLNQQIPPPPPPPPVTPHDYRPQRPSGPPQGIVSQVTGTAAPAQTPQQKLLAEELGASLDTDSGGQHAGVQEVSDTNSGQHRPGPLAQAMDADDFPTVKASVMSNPQWTLGSGTHIRCVLQGRIISELPGGVTCKTTEAAWSVDLTNLLVPKGSFVTGQIEHGIMQGQNRVFVVWQKITTPDYVRMHIDSPAAGPLGAAGVGGTVDTNFWPRFSGALMLSMVQDVGQAVANSIGRSGNGNLNINNTTNATSNEASIALRNSVDIPPILYVQQAKIVTIDVQRDVDFSGVYQDVVGP